MDAIRIERKQGKARSEGMGRSWASPRALLWLHECQLQQNGTAFARSEVRHYPDRRGSAWLEPVSKTSPTMSTTHTANKGQNRSRLVVAISTVLET